MKIRLDETLLEQGYVESLPEAFTLIMTGKVHVNETLVTKAGTLIRLNHDVIHVKQKTHPFVSRGGIKLAHALDVFSLDVQDRIAVDVGASTGGFTDCLLEAGASCVYAVDVGKNQLHSKLQNDERVFNWQGVNGRSLTQASFPSEAQPSIGVTDVSFVSLRHILPPLCASLHHTVESPSWVVALLKPQFEAEYELSPTEMKAFNGVIQDENQRQRIKDATLADLQNALDGWHLAGVEASPICGAKGNIEYITLWTPYTI
ncbi:MAG: TlyA family RNA methyltransferase [Vampirovibrionales bacterium]|jgi:23S rRNA (cytidine1920-2'-O)/16S rRNA (cytidine1409-2'-O)-methyltransferase|nr:TlyA family RNA methyltransferase [Vampirovibrionales bacterium]